MIILHKTAWYINDCLSPYLFFPIGKIERPFISNYFLSITKSQKIFFFFQSFSFSRAPIHRHSGWKMPETTFKPEVSAGMPMNREFGRAERLKERKEHFSQKRKVMSYRLQATSSCAIFRKALVARSLYLIHNPSKRN